MSDVEMISSEKIDIEILKQDPELLKIVNRVLDLNTQILMQNSELIKSVCPLRYHIKAKERK